MDRPIDYTSAMTNLKWDNADDYNAIQRYINSIRGKNKKLLKCVERISKHNIFTIDQYEVREIARQALTEIKE